MGNSYKVLNQTEVANYNAPTNAVEIDLSVTDYAPALPFVVLVDDITAGTAVKVDTLGGNTVTITKVAAQRRVGEGVGLICTKVYKTGTTVTKAFALN
jgi:hypothetical protein